MTPLVDRVVCVSPLSKDLEGKLDLVNSEPERCRTLKCKTLETHHLLTVAFSEPPRRMFPIDCGEAAEEFGRDHLTFELGDPGSISASFLAKVPGPKMRLGQAHMYFSYADSFGGTERALDAYERLMHDVMVGDRTLFTTSSAIERLWEVADPVVREPPRVELYQSGSWGPQATNELLAPHRWHIPSNHP